MKIVIYSRKDIKTGEVEVRANYDCDGQEEFDSANQVQYHIDAICNALKTSLSKDKDAPQ